MNALEIRNLQKSFGSHVVLDNLTMTVREGGLWFHRTERRRQDDDDESYFRIITG